MPSKTRKSELMYRRVRKTRKSGDGCNFCGFGHESRGNELIEVCEFFWVVRNIFPYDIWDDQHVVDHMMIVPKRHVESIGDLNDDESLEYTKIVGRYDLLGYSVYARSFKNAIKSVPHQHTHLIKMDNKEVRFMLFSKKPYILLKK